MTSTGIREFKKYICEELVKKYHMSETEAHRAIQDSYLSEALKRDSGFADHDTIEEWADSIYEEYNQEKLMQM